MKDVSSNHLGARGCQWMCDMLQNNVTLLKINLSDNDFSDKDTVFLLDALKVQNSVIDRFGFLRQTLIICSMCRPSFPFTCPF